MSFFDREKSAYGGQPLELYRFAMGDQEWAFTSADHEVVLSETEKYPPLYIKRGGFTRGGDTNKSTLEIEVAASNPVALLYRNGWLAKAVMVTILRRHYEDTESVMIWRGRVTGCKWAGSTATLTSDAATTLFQRVGLRRVFQVGCPHPLYGPACRLDAGAWQVSGTVTEVKGSLAAIAAAAAHADGYFLGGMLLFGVEYRLIVGHEKNQITLIDGIAGLAAGATVTLWPGCDRSTGCCADRFGNLDNYGGLPFLPQKNPFSGDAIV